LTPVRGVPRRQLARIRRTTDAVVSAAELAALEVMHLPDVLVVGDRGDDVFVQASQIIRRRLDRAIDHALVQMERHLSQSEAERLDAQVIAKESVRAFEALRRQVFDCESLEDLDRLRGLVLRGHFE
jgi:hypothetical protein